MSGWTDDRAWRTYLEIRWALENAAYTLAIKSGPNWVGWVRDCFLAALEDKAPNREMYINFLKGLQQEITFRLEDGSWTP